MLTNAFGVVAKINAQIKVNAKLKTRFQTPEKHLLFAKIKNRHFVNRNRQTLIGAMRAYFLCEHRQAPIEI